MTHQILSLGINIFKQDFVSFCFIQGTAEALPVVFVPLIYDMCKCFLPYSSDIESRKDGTVVGRASGSHRVTHYYAIREVSNSTWCVRRKSKRLARPRVSGSGHLRLWHFYCGADVASCLGELWGISRVQERGFSENLSIYTCSGWACSWIYQSCLEQYN